MTARLGVVQAVLVGVWLGEAGMVSGGEWRARQVMNRYVPKISGIFIISPLKITG